MKSTAISLILLLFGALLPLAARAGDPLVAEATAKKTFVFAEFISKTCPACEEMKPIVDAVLRRTRGVVHRVHDADLELELSKRYQVRCVPVYVIIDPRGEVRFNDVGLRTETELEEILREAGVRLR